MALPLVRPRLVPSMSVCLTKEESATTLECLVCDDCCELLNDWTVPEGDVTRVEWRAEGWVGGILINYLVDYRSVWRLWNEEGIH